MSTQGTELNLLTRDGVVCVRFAPALQSSEYTELLTVERDAVTLEQLKQLLQALGMKWKKSVVFEE